MREVDGSSPSRPTTARSAGKARVTFNQILQTSRDGEAIEKRTHGHMKLDNRIGKRKIQIFGLK